MAPTGTSLVSFGWLHLSDLHQGQQGQPWLWPSLRHMFFTDLQKLHEPAGPWDLVLFTGDLTQRGSAEEYVLLDRTLEKVWDWLGKLGSYPLLLAVPGNHDLVRPAAHDALIFKHWHEEHELREAFWGRRGQGRGVVEQAFAPYLEWQRRRLAGQMLPGGLTLELRTGPEALPGDFAATIEKGGARLALVGLNSAFLQLGGGDGQGKLALDPRQLRQGVCAPLGPAPDVTDRPASPPPERALPSSRSSRSTARSAFLKLAELARARRSASSTLTGADRPLDRAFHILQSRFDCPIDLCEVFRSPFPEPRGSTFLLPREIPPEYLPSR